jgi:hypothetical protein
MEQTGKWISGPEKCQSEVRGIFGGLQPLLGELQLLTLWEAGFCTEVFQVGSVHMGRCLDTVDKITPGTFDYSGFFLVPSSLCLFQVLF